MKYVPPLVRLNGAQKKEAVRVVEVLKSCNFDLDVWCERLGYILITVKPEEIFPADAGLLNEYIIVAKGTKHDMIYRIAHEHCHAMFHADCISHSDLHKFTAGHNEGQAIEFSRYVVEEL